MTEILFPVEEAAEGDRVAQLASRFSLKPIDLRNYGRMSARPLSVTFSEGETPKLIRLHIVRDEVLRA